MENTMQDKKEKNAAEIVLDGQAYKLAALNTEQQYLVRQMHALHQRTFCAQLPDAAVPEFYRISLH